jgi:[ribosomal protein S18]-alanine N-acetyltransferase
MARNACPPWSAAMLNPVSIRLADVNDAHRIAQMSRDLIELGLGWSWTAPRVRQSIADAQTNVVVVRDADAALQAFAIMRYRDDDAHLLLLAVQPERVRRGIGTALMGWLEKVALVAGVDRISLEARVSNATARAFYARLGYIESQVRPGYYQGREASVRMAKDLWLGQP